MVEAMLDRLLEISVVSEFLGEVEQGHVVQDVGRRDREGGLPGKSAGGTRARGFRRC